MRALLASALVVFASLDAYALCMAPRYGPKLLTPTDRPLPADGSLVVGLENARAGNTSAMPTLSLVREGTEIPLRNRALSSSLTVYTPARTPPPGRYRVQGFPAETTVEFSADRTQGELQAPRVRAVTRLVTQGLRGERATLNVTLQGSSPAFLILGEDEHGVVGWNADLTLAETTIFRSGRCGATPPGITRPVPDAGSTLRFRYIDHAGRVSAPSAPVRVTNR
ncbi:MAG: hypothetical protein AAGE52_29770 [Myxococcota bacterium]